jgi:hypothetical protein
VPDPSPKPVDLPFPPKGVDLSSEYELQPEGTCAVGQNVRLFEPTLSRARGGSRPGLSRFIPARVNGDLPVQHLNFVISNSADALLTVYDSQGGDGSSRRPRIVDPTTDNREEYPNGGGPMPNGSPPQPVPPGGGPTGGVNAPGTPTSGRNPGRTIPRGGSGVRPNRRQGSPPVANDDTGSAAIGGPSVDITVLANDTYIGTPTVEILSGPNFGSAVLVGTVVRYSPPAGGNPDTAVIVYKLTCTGMRGSDTATVTIRVSGAGEFRLICREYFFESPPDGGFPTVVCECNDPSRPSYTVTFGIPPNDVEGPSVPGGSLPSVDDMNAGADAAAIANGGVAFDPPLYTTIVGDTDSGPC